MTLLGTEYLDKFKKKHTIASEQIDCWVSDIEGSTFKIPQDIKKKYSSASFLKNNIVIFNIKGRDYRLEVKIAYQMGKIKIMWVGTHQEYDKRNKDRNS